MPEPVYQQVRRVVAGNVRATATGTQNDLDISIKVSHPKDGPLGFEATIKNLADRTWNSVGKGDPARISLGWQETKVPPVLLGTIDSVGTKAAGRDSDYVVKGRDHTGKQFRRKLSDSWDTLTPDAIARDIASQLSIAPGVIHPVPEPIDGYYQIDRQRPTRHWLNELVREAEKRSECQWQWFGRAGRFFFKRKDQPSESVVQLSNSSPRNLLEIGPSAGKSEKTSGEELEFKAILTPSLKKSDVVAVDTDRYSGTYQVTSYEHESDTITGSHFTSGTLVGADASFKSRFRGEIVKRGAGGIGFYPV